MRNFAPEDIPKTSITIFGVLIGLGICLDIASLASPSWVSSDDPFFGFKGNLHTLTESEGPYFTQAEEQTYSELRDTLCEIALDTSINGYKALCTLFGDLDSTFAGVLIGGLIGMAANIGAITGLCWGRSKSSMLVCSQIFPTVSLVVHLGTTLSYVLTNRLEYSGDCEQLIDNTLPEALCAETGPIILLVSLIYHILLCIAMIVFISVIRKKLGAANLPSTNPQINLNHNVTMAQQPPVKSPPPPPGYPHGVPPAGYAVHPVQPHPGYQNAPPNSNHHPAQHYPPAPHYSPAAQYPPVPQYPGPQYPLYPQHEVYPPGSQYPGAELVYPANAPEVSQSEVSNHEASRVEESEDRVSEHGSGRSSSSSSSSVR